MNPLPPKRVHRKLRPDVLPDQQDEYGSNIREAFSHSADDHKESPRRSNGPDCDVISSTSSGNDTVTSHTSEGSRLVKSLMRDGPKTAWSDGIEMQSLIHKSLNRNSRETGRRSDAEYSGFDNSSFSVETSDGSDKLLESLEEGISGMTDLLEKWQTTRSAVERNARQAKHDVERRKKAAKGVILKYVQSLNDDIAARSKVNFDEIDKSVEEIESKIHRMKKLRESYSSLRSKDHVRLLKECVREFEQDSDGLKVPEKQDRYQFHSVVKQSEDDQFDMIHKLLGTIVTSSKPVRMSSDDDEFDDSLDNTLRMNGLTERNPNDCLLAVPELVRTFNCRMKKDKRACGITDIAISDEGNVYVVDKHNKAIKVYDSRGCFEKYLGAGLVRKPSRISFLATRREILVSDEASKSMHLFRADGSHIRELVDMHFPVGHCQTSEGGVAAIEFTTKSVAIFNKEGNIEKSFATRLDCPAYIASTRNSRLVVSDWKSGCVRMFDPDGSEVHTWSRNTSEESIQPYGICADRFGNVLVADRTGRAVVCLHEDGDVLREYDDENHKIGFPFALTCGYGSDKSECQLVAAEYSGTVKLFSYLEPTSPSPTNASNC